jgi:hypothetical protein
MVWTSIGPTPQQNLREGPVHVLLANVLGPIAGRGQALAFAPNLQGAQNPWMPALFGPKSK